MPGSRRRCETCGAEWDEPPRGGWGPHEWHHVHWCDRTPGAAVYEGVGYGLEVPERSCGVMREIEDA